MKNTSNIYKRVQFKFFYVFFFCFFLFVLWTSLAYAENFESWNNISLAFKINDKTKIMVDDVFRFNNRGRDFYHLHSSFILDYKWLNWLTAGGKLRFTFERSKNVWQLEVRPRTHATFGKKFSNFEISDQNRFEYRYFAVTDDVLRYRNTLALGYSFQFDHFTAKLFISDEIFVEFNENNFNRNRVYVGAKFSIWKKYDFTPTYFFQTDYLSNKTKYSHVLNLKVTVLF